MHVLIIPSWYPKSTNDINGSFFREQAIALAAANCKVGVIYSQRRSIRECYRSPYGLTAQNDNGVFTLRRNGVKWLSLFSNGNNYLWLRDGIKLYKHYVKYKGVPDIVHAHAALYGGVLASNIHQRFGVPYVVTEHSTGYARNMLNDQQRHLAAEAVRSALRRIAVSEPFCNLLQNYFGEQGGLWEPLPNIVNRSFFDYPIRGADARAREFVFVSIALLTPKKGVRDLVNAFALAFSGNKDVRLIIGGDGVERLQLEKLVEQLGMTSQVKFLGALTREQVLQQVAAADAFVSGSHYETFGVAVAEALALGKPVVTTRCGGPESIVRNSDGIVVEVDDVHALATAMKNIRSNIAKYDAQKIRQACLNRYGESVVAARLLNKYYEALESR